MSYALSADFGPVPAPVSADPNEPVTIQVRGGRVVGAGSWLYVWIRLQPRGVVYAGGTPLPPAVRTWMHLNDPDPTVGRMAARLPRIAEEDFDVLAFALPRSVARQEARGVLVRALGDAGLLAEDHVCDPPPPRPGYDAGSGYGHGYHPDLLATVSTVVTAVSGALVR